MSWVRVLSLESQEDREVRRETVHYESKNGSPLGVMSKDWKVYSFFISSNSEPNHPLSEHINRHRRNVPPSSPTPRPTAYKRRDVSIREGGEEL